MSDTAGSIPMRMDRLPWSRWHWRVVLALGIAWVLDGLEVTLIGSIGGILERSDTLALSAAQVGLDRLGLYRRRGAGRAGVRPADRPAGPQAAVHDHAGGLHAGHAGHGLFHRLRILSVCRFITGLGIGGEYAAINSAIDELIPARVRGRVNLSSMAASG